VAIAAYVGAPLLKRVVGQQRKNKMKDYLEGGSGKKTDTKESEKAKKLVRGKCKYPNYGELGHRKSSYRCPLNGTKKRQVTHFFMPLMSLFSCAGKGNKKIQQMDGSRKKRLLLRLNIPPVLQVKMLMVHLKTWVVLCHHARKELCSRK
jgi:hypothetical protein